MIHPMEYDDMRPSKLETLRIEIQKGLDSEPARAAEFEELKADERRRIDSGRLIRMSESFLTCC